MQTETLGPALVELARGTILHALGGPAPDKPTGSAFQELGATFVTITRNGQLHGCIGSIAPRRPLVDDVEENAIAAAFRDPRSMPFRSEWIPEMGVEVTLLGPLSPITFSSEEDLIRQLVPHEDGLVLRWHHRRGTFLPQVWDSLEDPREFLAELKMKAGLPPHFWADDLEVSRFHVQKWGDRRPPATARSHPHAAT